MSGKVQLTKARAHTHTRHRPDRLLTIPSHFTDVIIDVYQNQSYYFTRGSLSSYHGSTESQIGYFLGRTSSIKLIPSTMRIKNSLNVVLVSHFYSTRELMSSSLAHFPVVTLIQLTPILRREVFFVSMRFSAANSDLLPDIYIFTFECKSPLSSLSSLTLAYVNTAELLHLPQLFFNDFSSTVILI